MARSGRHGGESGTARREGYPKPVAAYVAGRTAPPGKRMGHSGAIVGAARGYRENVEALRSAGIRVAEALHEASKPVAGPCTGGRG